MIGNSIIKLNKVNIFQQKHLVLSNVDLHIDKGDFVWLIGQTGSGKSSLLKLLYGDLSPANGTGYACGYELDRLTTREIPFLRRKLGIVFQDFQLLTDRSVEQNLQFVMRATGWTDKKLISDRALDVLEKVGLRSKLKKMPHELSGGEQQRVAVARALINNPDIVFADEPTGNLDSANARELHKVFIDLRNKFNQTFLIVTHNEELAKLGDRVLYMKDGKIV